MLIIDRFEGEYALIAYKKKLFHVPKSLIPKGAKGGDVIDMQITIDRAATQNRKEAMAKPAEDR